MNSSQQRPRPPVTDSGWFWAGLFSLMALVGMAAIREKFDVRQRQVEGRFLGRQQAANERQRRAAGLPEIDLAESARDRSEVAPGIRLGEHRSRQTGAIGNPGEVFRLLRGRPVLGDQLARNLRTRAKAPGANPPARQFFRYHRHRQLAQPQQWG